MKILTTSDLSYVSGGDDGGCSANVDNCTPAQVEATRYAQGIATTIDSAGFTSIVEAAAAYARWLTQNGQTVPPAAPNYYNGMGDFN